MVYPVYRSPYDGSIYEPSAITQDAEVLQVAASLRRHFEDESSIDLARWADDGGAL